MAEDRNSKSKSDLHPADSTYRPGAFNFSSCVCVDMQEIAFLQEHRPEMLLGTENGTGIFLVQTAYSTLYIVIQHQYVFPNHATLAADWLSGMSSQLCT